MAGKTLIGGTEYTIKGGKTLVGGTGYSIKQGKTLIGGTSKTIKFGAEPYYIFQTNAVNNCTNTWKQRNRTVTISSEKIYSYASTGSYSWANVCSNSKIDLSQYETLYLDFSNVTSEGNAFTVILRDSQPTSQPSIDDAIAYYGNTSRGVYSVDISSYTASKYIVLVIHEVSTLNVYNWWVE